MQRAFTWGLSQVECFTLLEGRHFIEGLVFSGVFEAVKVHALTVDDDVWELFVEFDIWFLKQEQRDKREIWNWKLLFQFLANE